MQPDLQEVSFSSGKGRRRDRYLRITFFRAELEEDGHAVPMCLHY